jgi:hypothetical protein
MRNLAELSGASKEPGVIVNTKLAAWNREQEFTSLKSRASLGLSGVPYSKAPDSQEAAVVAIFYELPGCAGLGVPVRSSPALTKFVNPERKLTPVAFATNSAPWLLEGNDADSLGEAS